jgi:hypothetical protein
MRYPTTVHPTRMDVGSVENAKSNFQPWTYAKPALPPSMVVGGASERTWTPCFYVHRQCVSGDGFQFMSRVV